MELELPDDPFDVTRIDVSNAPTLVTLNKVRYNFRSHYVYRFTLLYPEAIYCVAVTLLDDDLLMVRKLGDVPHWPVFRGFYLLFTAMILWPS